MESDTILDSQEVEQLATLVEEATRSTEEGIKRFVEPAQGTLRRAISKRHHIVFGRRGSGKSSLLRKAAADLTVDRRPIAYVDLEIFKGHSYPDVLLSVLIESLTKFEDWLKTAAIHPANKTSFWQKLFGTKPNRSAFNREKANKLANDIHSQVEQLKNQLYSADDIKIQKTIKQGQEASEQAEAGAKVGVSVKLLKADVSSKLSGLEKRSSSEEVQEAFHKSKVDFLHRHILEYQSLFRQISTLSGGDSYLFLDDLYHLQRSDQARVIDYFHRIAKGNGLWLKVGTIRHRTEWYIHGDPIIGVKLGDDVDDIDSGFDLGEIFAIKGLFG